MIMPMLSDVRAIARLWRDDRAAQLDLVSALAFLRARRLLRFGRTYVSKGDETLVVRLLGQKVHCFNLDTLVYLFREIFVGRTYDVPLPASPVVVDAGANIGVASLFFRWRYPGAQIHAFEPDSRTFSALVNTARSNSWESFAVENVALGDHDGPSPFFSYPAKPGRLTMSISKRDPLSEETCVSVVRLSTRLPAKVDLLKLDVEGQECTILADLEGAGGLERICQIVVECHPQGQTGTTARRVMQILRRNDFEVTCSPTWPDDKTRNVVLHARHQ